MKIYLQQPDGKPAGPYDEATLRGYLAQGSLSPGAYAWVEGTSDWRPVGEILGMTAPPGFPPMAPGAGPVAAPRANTSCLGKLLMGCGVLAIVAVLALAALIGYQKYQEGRYFRGRSRSADLTAMDEEMKKSQERQAREWADLQAEIARDKADPAHYMTVQTDDPDGGTTTTITPRGSASTGRQQITIQVGADGKTTTTAKDTDGTTMVRTEDKNGNVTVVTNRP